jgi:hypothetical protein
MPTVISTIVIAEGRSLMTLTRETRDSVRETRASVREEVGEGLDRE